MLTTASVHLSPLVTAPISVALAVVVTWYWLRLGRADVPVSRRRIRRASLAIVFVTIPLIFAALSIVDPDVRASAYVILWSVCLLCLLLIVVTAVMDAVNSMQLHRQAAHEAALDTTAQIIRSIHRHDNPIEGVTTNDAADEGAAS